MTASEVAINWYGLQRPDPGSAGERDHWTLPVSEGIATGNDFLFGGAALGACLTALEGTTGRAGIWATAQYLSFAPTGSTLDIEIEVVTVGRNITMASATGTADGVAVVGVNAALGARPHDLGATWAERPDVPRPEQCEPRTSRWATGSSIMTRLEQRWARRDPERGHTAVWARFTEVDAVPGSLLGVLGDFVPLGLSEALQPDNTSNSLDNTLRLTDVVPTEWVLVDIRVDQVSRGIGHGVVYLWAEDGTLMGTASQSAIIRLL